MGVLLAIFWTIWRAQNYVTFQNGREDPFLGGMKALGWLHAYESLLHKESSRGIPFPTLV